MFKRVLLGLTVVMVIVSAGPAVSANPERGNYVPADPNLKTHPFVENVRYGGTYLQGELLEPTKDGWKVRISGPSGTTVRRIPSTNMSITRHNRTRNQSVVVKKTAKPHVHYLVTDVNRLPRYLALILVSLVVCLIVGGILTLRSIGGVVIGLVFLWWIGLPMITEGVNIPFLVGSFYVIVACVVLAGSLGLNRKCLSAILAAFSSGILAFVLLYGVAHLMNVTGLRNESLRILEYATRYFPRSTAPISFLNLILGATLIGALGVILDVCVDVTSSTAEIARARPDLSLTEHFNRTLKVSSQLIGTMTNTLLLAYIGSDMFLILTVYVLPTPGWIVMNQDFLAVEVLRGVGGALGFLSAAPLSILFYRLIALPAEQLDRGKPPAPEESQ